MTDISQLSTQSTLSDGDLLPIWSSNNSDARKVSVYSLAVYLQDALTAGGGMVTQYAAPSATGFSVTVTPPVAGATMWLLLTPVGAYAAGAVVLPDSTSAIMGQEVLVTTTQAITALTLTSAGASIVGAPTTMAANAFFRLRYDSVLKTWYRIS